MWQASLTFYIDTQEFYTAFLMLLMMAAESLLLKCLVVTIAEAFFLFCLISYNVYATNAVVSACTGDFAGRKRSEKYWH